MWTVLSKCLPSNLKDTGDFVYPGLKNLVDDLTAADW